MFKCVDEIMDSNDSRKARIVKVESLYRLDVSIEIDGNGEPYIQWDNYDLGYDHELRAFQKTPDRVIPMFPIIYKRDSTPWDLGNLYLYDYWCVEADLDSKPMATILKKAKNLLSYLQWLESNELDVFHAPARSRKFQRCTYMYKKYLESEVIKAATNGRGEGLAQSTASGKAAEVAQFYQWIEAKNSVLSFLPKDLTIKNVFYSEVKSMQKYGKGFTEVVGTDLHLRKSTIRDYVFDGHIYAEEGTTGVMPLSERDTQFILWALEAIGEPQMQLMFWLMLLAGARKQVVCTITVGAIKSAIKTYENERVARIPVGSGTEIDNKNNHFYYLHVPMPLLKKVHDWINYSPIYKRRQAISFYGEDDRNYAFLTKNGNPFYIAKRQIRDLEDITVSRSVAKKDRISISGKSNDGSSLNYFSNHKVIPWIESNFSSFVDRWNELNGYDKSFTPDDGTIPFQVGFHLHNLRATFGMRFIRTWERSLIKAGKEFNNKERGLCMGRLMKMMGHENESTTWHYLDYDSLLNEQGYMDVAVEKAIYPNNLSGVF